MRTVPLSQSPVFPRYSQNFQFAFCIQVARNIIKSPSFSFSCSFLSFLVYLYLFITCLEISRWFVQRCFLWTDNCQVFITFQVERYIYIGLCSTITTITIILFNYLVFFGSSFEHWLFIFYLPIFIFYLRRTRWVYFLISGKRLSESLLLLKWRYANVQFQLKLVLFFLSFLSYLRCQI